MKSYLVSFMNIEHLRRSLKALWLDYYRENRVWLTKLGVWVNCEGNRRPSSSFILGTLSVLEPQLTQMLPLVVDLSSNPDRVVMALGLNFNPDEELAAIELATIEQASSEEVKLLSPFGVALPRLVQPMEAQPIAVQASQAAQPVAAQDVEPRQQRSPVGQLVTKQVSQPNSQPPSAPELHKPELHKPELHKPELHKSESKSFEVGKSYSAPASLSKSSSQTVNKPEPLPIRPALERPALERPALEKKPAPEIPKTPSSPVDEPRVKQRPPMDTAELAQGQQPDRGTSRKQKGDRPASPV